MSDFANRMNIIEVIDILVRGFRIAMILFSPLKLDLVKSCEVLNLIGTFIHQYDASGGTWWWPQSHYEQCSSLWGTAFGSQIQSGSLFVFKELVHCGIVALQVSF